MLKIPSQASEQTYTVVAGDNLEKIAKTHGKTVEQILALNPQIKDKNKISVGMSLKMPATPLKTVDEFYKDLGMRESGGNYGAENRLGYLGKYQMGEQALVEAGYYKKDVKSYKDYNNDWKGTFTGKDGVFSKVAYVRLEKRRNGKRNKAFYRGKSRVFYLPFKIKTSRLFSV